MRTPDRSRHSRSRVTNGKELLPGIDGRSAAARRYRDVMQQLTSDVGDDPSAAKVAIIRRACSLIVVCEQAEAELLAGSKLDVAEFVTATNALRRLLTDLGLERKARDVTPSLQQYIASKSAANLVTTTNPTPTPEKET